MNQSRNIRAKWNISNEMIRSIVFHVLFYWSRFIILCVGVTLNATNLIKFLSDKSIVLSDALKFCFQFNIFLLYIAIDATIRENTFKYYFSIVIMFHNAILFAIIPATVGFTISFKFWIIFGLSIFSFLIEGSISIVMSYLQRNEKNLELFKKVGANPKINNAFATRKALETFGQANLFFAFILFEVFWIPPNKLTQLIQLYNYLIVLITFIQQLSISVRFNNEIVIQRKISIGISYFKIIAVIGLVAWRSAIHVRGNINTRLDYFHTVLNIDILFVSAAMQYYLIKDFNQFGSGLKEYLKDTAKSINLSSRKKIKSK